MSAEDQEKILRAEEVPPPLQETDVLRKDPGGRGQEQPSGELRDEVLDDNPPNGVGGTVYGIRRCPRGVTSRPHREERIALPLSAGREKGEMTECENQKRKCKVSVRTLILLLFWTHILMQILGH